MDIQKALQETEGFINLDILANQVVEGFISGMHKSPFHGFSAEFAEHKIYNFGESTKHIDWKLFARTDKLYTKRYDDETNLRCHLIIDNSSSMHFPILKQQSIEAYNKIGFSVLASAALMRLLKRQRDTVGLSLYSANYDFYAPEKGSERHHHMLLNVLETQLKIPRINTATHAYENLHLIAEKLHKRSLVILFSDMFQSDIPREKLFDALRHLKYNKHEVVLFHVYDAKSELNLQFENSPKRFVDVETGEAINVYPDNVKEVYTASVSEFFKALSLHCAQYQIKYVPADINLGFNAVMTRFLIERDKFL